MPSFSEMSTEGQVAQACVELANVPAGQSLGCPVTVTLMVIHSGTLASMFSHDSSVNSVCVMCIALNNNIAAMYYTSYFCLCPINTYRNNIYFCRQTSVLIYTFFADVGTDFTIPFNLNLVFATGSVDGEDECLSISTTQDFNFEGTHTFQVAIASISPPIINPPADGANVNIMDNDGKQRINQMDVSLLATVIVTSTYMLIQLPIFTCPSVDTTVQLTSSSFSGTEGDLTTAVCVQAVLGSPTGIFEAPLTVQLTPTPGSAGQLSDYIILQYIISLPCLGFSDYSPSTISSVTFTSVSGNMLCVIFTLVDDTIQEPPKTFTVAITNTGGATLGSPSSAVVTIHDNDGQYTILVVSSCVLC